LTSSSSACSGAALRLSPSAALRRAINSLRLLRFALSTSSTAQPSSAIARRAECAASPFPPRGNRSGKRSATKPSRAYKLDAASLMQQQLVSALQVPPLLLLLLLVSPLQVPPFEPGLLTGVRSTIGVWPVRNITGSGNASRGNGNLGVASPLLISSPPLLK
jgi:hypothetical protein